MERKNGTDQPPVVAADTSSPETGIPKQQQPNNDARSGNESGAPETVDTADIDLVMSSNTPKAFTESVQEEIKGENDALIISTYSSDIKKKPSNDSESA